MAKYNKVTYSNSQAAVAQTYTTTDAQADDTLYFSVLTGDPASATLYSVGTTNATMTVVSGNVVVPTDIIADTSIGTDYQSALGAAISMTAAGQVAYDMQPISAQIDALTAGQLLVDSFYYAIKIADGTVSWNTVTVDIYGQAANIGIFQEAGSVTEAFNWQSPPQSPTDALSDGGAITAFAASGNLTTITVTPAAGDQGTLTLDPAGAVYDSDIGALAYHFTYSASEAAVYATHKGYGEKAFTDSWTVTTANGTTQRFSEEVYGNIHAPVVTASAGKPQGSSVALYIAASDHDDNASLTYSITGVPIGARLTSAADAPGISYDSGNHTWSVATAALADLQLDFGSMSGDSGCGAQAITLNITVTNTEANPINAADIASVSTSTSISASMSDEVFLTPGYDDLVLTSGPNIVGGSIGPGATLNPGDYLEGSGSDTLDIMGVGFFDLNSLAAFTGFSTINLCDSGSDLTLQSSSQLTINSSSATPTGFPGQGGNTINEGANDTITIVGQCVSVNASGGNDATTVEGTNNFIAVYGSGSNYVTISGGAARTGTQTVEGDGVTVTITATNNSPSEGYTAQLGNDDNVTIIGSGNGIGIYGTDDSISSNGNGISDFALNIGASYGTPTNFRLDGTGNEVRLVYQLTDVAEAGGGNGIQMENSSDALIFVALPSKADSVSSFSSGDTFGFDDIVFGNGLAIGGGNSGPVDPSHFVANASGPENAAQVFWYDTANDTLYYDQDGSGPGSALALAQVSDGFPLQSSDLFMR